MIRNWADHFKSAYKKSRKTVAYLLVVSVPIISKVGSHEASVATLIVLGFILLPILFEIHDKVTESANPTVFDNFYAASNSISEEIEKLALNGRVEIRYLVSNCIN